MERLTIEQARARIATNAGPGSLVDPNSIDWTQPGREAITIACLVQSTDNFEERSRIIACALALLGYQALLDFAAGQADERANAASLLRQMAADVLGHGGLGDAYCSLREAAILVERGDRAETA